MPTEPIVLDAPADLATGGSAELFSGADHGIDVSFFLNHAAPGSGAEAHRHPYAEVFVVRAAQPRRGARQLVHPDGTLPGLIITGVAGAHIARNG